MHRRGHAQPERVEARQQRRVLPERIAVLHAEKNEVAPAGGNARRILRLQRQREPVGMRLDHRMDLADPGQRRLQCGRAPLRRQRPLRDVGRPEATVESALDHARQIHLRTVVRNAVAIFNRQPLTLEPGRRVEVGVERDQFPVQARRIAPRIVGRIAGAGSQHQAVAVTST